MIRMVSDENGRLLEVILGSAEYQDVLRILARSAAWETLPPYLQDAIDHLLADEARTGEGDVADQTDFRMKLHPTFPGPPPISIPSRTSARRPEDTKPRDCLSRPPAP